MVNKQKSSPTKAIGARQQPGFQPETAEPEIEQTPPNIAPMLTRDHQVNRRLLNPAGVLDLQRTIGNKAVARLIASRNQPRPPAVPPASTLQVVQRTVQENTQILAGIPATAADPTYTSEGNKDDEIKLATESFITGNSGTWHHIYPRNLLKRNLENISKYFVATNGREGQMTTTGTKSHQAMVNMASSLPMDATGRLSKPARYYWKHGNGFAGVRSDYRTDDPGQLVEHGKPPEMSSKKYQVPRNWGKELEKLSIKLGSLAGLTEDKLDSTDAEIAKMAGVINTFSLELNDAIPHRTVSEKEGKDWERKDKGKPWGDAIKNYKLKT